MKFSDLYGDEIGRPVQFYPRIARLCGGVKAAVLLGQLLYWADKGADPEGWVYKSMEELEDETGLTRHEQEHARKHLKSLGLLLEKYEGLPRRLYFRILVQKLDAAVDAYLQKSQSNQYSAGKRQTSMPQNDRQARQKPGSKIAENQQPGKAHKPASDNASPEYSESHRLLPEITQETTTSKSRAATVVVFTEQIETALERTNTGTAGNRRLISDLLAAGTDETVIEVEIIRAGEKAKNPAGYP